jgi:predicted aconitase with swiveling domain
MAQVFKGRKVVRGCAKGEAVVFPGSFSFLGDVDMDTGEVLVEPNKGVLLAGKVLIYRETKGSSGGCVVLMTLANKGRAPAAIVTVKAADYNLAEGAILAKIPFVCEVDEEILSVIRTGEKVSIDADAGVVASSE